MVNPNQMRLEINSDPYTLILRTKNKPKKTLLCNPVEGQTEAELMQILVTTVQGMPWQALAPLAGGDEEKGDRVQSDLE